MMSFSGDLRSELCAITSARRCCQLSELAGMLAAGSVESAGNEARLELPNPAQGRKVVRLYSALSGTDPGLEVRRGTARSRIRLTLPLDLLAPDDRAALSRPPAQPCCEKSFLRGLFAVRGYAAEPPASYHLEIPLDSPATAEAAAQLFRAWDVAAGLVTRRGRHVVYIKGSENMSRALGVIGSSRGLMGLEGKRVFREVRNDVNRRLNFETANLRRGVESAAAQLHAIERLGSAGALDHLTPALREAAELRLRWPRAGLTELARVSGQGKSALNHRLRRLVRMAGAPTFSG